MALRNRIYFFDPANDDRFSSRDIPTEQTMLDWCDSVPFIKEVNDRSQLSRAGIAKTTTDAKINAGDNTDVAGVSPVGFTTFVRPNQIPVILNSASIIWTRVPRGGATTGDTGAGISDWSAAVQFPAFPDYDSSDIAIIGDFNIDQPNGALCDPLSSITVNVPDGDPIQTLLVVMNAAINNLTNRVVELAAASCAASDNAVDIGDIILVVTPASAWSSNWLEPRGQSLLRASYPELFSLFGTTYGSVSILHFNLPDLVTEQNYFKVRQNTNNIIPLAGLNGGITQKALVEEDLPIHTHTVTGNTTSNGEHDHTFPVHEAQTGFTVVDGNGGDPDFNNYTTPLGGDHNHTITGTTDSFGNITPDNIWDTNTANTPRFTNFYLKMRVL